MLNDANLDNTAMHFKERYLTARKAFNEKSNGCDDMCRELLQCDFLKSYHRASLNIMLSFSDDAPEECLVEAMRVIGQMD
jgi:hypothetical protein